MVGFIGGTVGPVFVNFLDPFFIGLYMSLLFAVIGSKLHPVSEEETAYRERLMIVPEQERIAEEYKKDYVFGYILIAADAFWLRQFFYWAGRFRIMGIFEPYR